MGALRLVELFLKLVLVCCSAGFAGNNRRAQPKD
jgi:hypothetical protein